MEIVKDRHTRLFLLSIVLLAVKMFLMGLRIAWGQLDFVYWVVLISCALDIRQIHKHLELYALQNDFLTTMSVALASVDSIEIKEKENDD